MPGPANAASRPPTVRGVFDPLAADLDQALTAARLRAVMPPAVFSLVGAILARLLAKDGAAMDDQA